MIPPEPLTINNHTLIHTYNDAGLKIRKDGTDEIYDEAIDPVESNRTYGETDKPVEVEEE